MYTIREKTLLHKSEYNSRTEKFLENPLGNMDSLKKKSVTKWF